jgi:hypothetical protein
MATLEELRNEKMISIHGRKMALDKDAFIVGPKGRRQPITSATSDTTGTALPNSGHCSVVTTTDDTWTLTDPVEGCVVNIKTGSTSTGVHTITFAAAAGLSSVSSTGTGVTLTGGGAAIELVGLTTALWAIQSRTGTTAQSYMSS